MRRGAGAGALLVAVSLLVAACSDDGPADPEVVDALTDVRWRIAGYVDGDEVAEVARGGEDAYIEFRRDGTMQGDDGCAGWRTIERYDLRSTEIRYDGLIAMEGPLCSLPDQHQDAYNAIQGGNVDFELDGDQLTLVGDHGIGVVFTRAGG